MQQSLLFGERESSLSFFLPSSRSLNMRLTTWSNRVEDWIILIVSSVPAIWPLVQKGLRLVNNKVGKRVFGSKFLTGGTPSKPSGHITSGQSSHARSPERGNWSNIKRFRHLGTSSSATKDYDVEEDGIAMTQDIMVKHDEIDSGADIEANASSNFDWRGPPQPAAKVNEPIWYLQSSI